jgi:hypothetical protein
MKIFVPYTEIDPVTAQELKAYNYTPIMMINDNDYQEYFKQRWAEGEPFINCEHDALLWSGAIEQLEQCNEDWCAFGVYDQDSFVDKIGTTPTLNLVKFSGSFIKRYHDLWNAPVFGKWRRLDAHIYIEVTANHGEICHQHFPVVMNGFR